MVQITFVEPDSTRKTVEAEVGLSVMEVAVRHNIDGIKAECGGQCSCATCHIYVDEDYFERVGAPMDDEEDMLDFSDNRQPTSRLGCQVDVTEALDGMTVQVAVEDM